MLFRILLALLTLPLTMTSAQALVFIEPTVGYASGNGTTDGQDILSSESDSFDFDIKGLSYGARGGLSLGGFQLGLDYTINNLTTTSDDEFEEDDFKSKELAAFLGFRFNFFRLYGGYIFDAKVDDSDFESGEGLKAGLTFYALRNLALSFEYRNLEMDTYSDEDGVLWSLDYNAMAFMVSFPFEI